MKQWSTRGDGLTRRAFIALLLILLLVGCGGDTPAGTPTAAPTATAGATATLPQPQVIVPRPENATAAATVTAAVVATTAPPSPTPTSGPLNEPVPVVAKGGASCEDYPCFDDVAGWEARIQLPAGFQATYFAHVNGTPTSLTFGPDGQLYVALYEGQIVTIAADGTVNPYVDGFLVPVALAFQPGTGRLWVSSRVSYTEAQVSVIEGSQISQLIGGIPCCYASMHAANGIAFGPDGYAYLAVGARADHGEVLNSEVQDERHPWEASILRISPDGRQVESYARGFRNAYDIAWDGSGRLYASDNGPDFGPPEEFHLVVPGGEHGYPWYVCDNCFPPPAGVTIVPPRHELLAHSAPTGMTAYLAEQFPGYYNNIFLTLWSAFEGAQKIVRFGPGGEGMTDFATGFAAPIDVTVGPDGSLYVADFATGIIFRISYTG